MVSRYLQVKVHTCCAGRALKSYHLRLLSHLAWLAVLGRAGPLLVYSVAGAENRGANNVVFGAL
jgi:hypothetical protein